MKILLNLINVYLHLLFDPCMHLIGNNVVINFKKIENNFYKWFLKKVIGHNKMSIELIVYSKEKFIKWLLY